MSFAHLLEEQIYKAREKIGGKKGSDKELKKIVGKNLRKGQGQWGMMR